MNKNEKSEKRSSGVCDKMFGGIRRRQAPDPPQSKPVVGDWTNVVLENGEGKSPTSGSGANKPKFESTLGVDQESKGSGDDIDHRSTTYINRTWLKIRSMTTVGVGKTHMPTKDTSGGKTHMPTKDTRHDQFADYITRAKKKFQKISTMRGGGGGAGGGGGFSSK